MTTGVAAAEVGEVIAARWRNFSSCVVSWGARGALDGVGSRGTTTLQHFPDSSLNSADFGLYAWNFTIGQQTACPMQAALLNESSNFTILLIQKAQTKQLEVQCPVLAYTKLEPKGITAIQLEALLAGKGAPLLITMT